MLVVAWQAFELRTEEVSSSVQVTCAAGRSVGR